MVTRALRISALLGLLLPLPAFSQSIPTKSDVQKKEQTEAVKDLSEISKLKAENHTLKIQLTQCQVNLLDAQSKIASFELSQEQLKLEEEFRNELKAPKDTKFNWSTLKFEPIKSGSGGSN